MTLERFYHEMKFSSFVNVTRGFIISDVQQNQKYFLIDDGGTDMKLDFCNKWGKSKRTKYVPNIYELEEKSLGYHFHMIFLNLLCLRGKTDSLKLDYLINIKENVNDERFLLLCQKIMEDHTQIQTVFSINHLYKLYKI